MDKKERKNDPLKLRLLLEYILPRILLFIIINEPFQLSMITFKWEMNINTESSRLWTKRVHSSFAIS